METAQLKSTAASTADKIRETHVQDRETGLRPRRGQGIPVQGGGPRASPRGSGASARHATEGRVKQRGGTAASPPTADSFESVSTKVAQLMTGLDADVEKIREEARAETGLIILDAKAEASRIEAEAHRTRNAADHALAAGPERRRTGDCPSSSLGGSPCGRSFAPPAPGSSRWSRSSKRRSGNDRTSGRSCSRKRRADTARRVHQGVGSLPDAPK